ncbi:hypothetical protein AgCh_006273 [Apium graveolens]
MHLERRRGKGGAITAVESPAVVSDAVAEKGGCRKGRGGSVLSGYGQQDYAKEIKFRVSRKMAVGGGSGRRQPWKVRRWWGRKG